jgi:NAD(P)-dependent dehydrogenase (short-subunit alcohol dehydrogenase family)
MQQHTALVIGASGGIGSAVAEALRASPRCTTVWTLSRRDDGLDLLDEASIRAAAARLRDQGARPDLIFDATGALEVEGTPPDKAMKQWDPDTMLRSFAINAVGPAMLLKHFADLLPRDRKAAFATLSARVGSIDDNRLGGWTTYRTAKAALNQVVRCAAIEIARKRPQAVIVALHPGTIETALTRKYARGRYTATPDQAALQLLTVLDGLSAQDTGGFFAYDGSPIAW